MPDYMRTILIYETDTIEIKGENETEEEENQVIHQAH